MRAALLSLLLLAASPLFGAFRLEPPQPTNRTPVLLQVREIWPDGCLPQNRRVTRSGSTIEVAWDRSALPCPAVLRAWNEDVPLGILEAGEYTVIARVDRVLATLKLVVTEEAPALRVEPRVLSSNVTTEVTIIAPGFCADGTPVVTVDNVAVAARAEQCAVIATFPAHAPGSATVRARFAGRDFVTVAAVRYIDPDAAPDESLFERILIPVIYNGPGAFGSQWVTEVEIVNRSDRTLTWPLSVSQPLPPVARGASTSLSVFGNHAAGLLLFVPRDQEVAFGSMIRDISRDASQWGTEMPVVREDDVWDQAVIGEAIVLPNVPFDPRYRLQLRVYGIDGVPFSGIVSASRDGFRRSAPLSVGGPCPQSPCNSNQPAFATVDLMQTFPSLTGRQQITISILPSSRETPRVWAFVTVTNNVTQQVTTISPQ